MTLDEFAAKVVGTPFRDRGRDYDAMDCWGLCWLAYRDVYGVELRRLDHYETTNDPVTLEAIVRREQDTSWREVQDPQPGDVVVLRVMGRHSHVGLVLGQGLMLHAQEQTEACIERYDGASWRKRVEDFWRHESRS